jgi:hypothetical protein
MPQRTGAGDHTGAVHLGVVEHQGGQAERLGQRGTRVEAGPRVEQFGIDPGARPAAGHVVRCRHHHAVPEHAGHADGDPVGGRQPGAELDQSLHEEVGGQRIRRRDAYRLGAHRAGLVEDRALDAAATAVDRQGESHAASLHG